MTHRSMRIPRPKPCSEPEQPSQRRRSGFKQMDIVRAVRGVHAAGLSVTRIEIEGGKITIHTAPAGELATQSGWEDCR